VVSRAMVTNIYFLFGNGVTIWVGLTLTNRISKTFQVWYPIVHLYGRSTRKGYFLNIVGSIPGVTPKQKYIRYKLERLLYITNGFYKSLEVTTNRKGCIGEKEQFKRGLILESTSVGNFVLQLLDFAKYPDIQLQAREVLKFWKKFLDENPPTIIIWIFQLSLISVFGGKIDPKAKQIAYEEICKFFLNDLVTKGSIKYSDLESIYYAASFLTKPSRRNEFEVFVEDLLDSTYSRSAQLESGPTFDFLREINHKWNQCMQIRHRGYS